jgi:hypothetical protein
MWINESKEPLRMTIQVTIKHDSPGLEKRLRIRVYESVLYEDGGRFDTLVSEIYIEPGEQHQLYIWGNRFFEVDES